MKSKLIFFIGVVIVGLLIFFNYYTRIYFTNNNEIMKNLNQLKQLELKLDYEILSDSVYLYKNFDEIIVIENEFKNTLQKLKTNKFFKAHKDAYNKFLKYEKDIKTKIEKVYNLESLIAPLKNSTMYLSEMLLYLPKIDSDKKFYKSKVLSIISEIYLIKNSFDLGFIDKLKYNLNNLKKIEITNKDLIKFNKIFQRNLNLFVEYFPNFINNINLILNYQTQTELKTIRDEFLLSTNKKLRIITIVSLLLILFVISSVITIYYLFYKVEEENEKLEEMLITDGLTKLYNRYKLEYDIQTIKNPVLFIINIDRFKYYNDFYGVQTGDFILKETANSLKTMFPSFLGANFYRIGGDDFGILLQRQKVKNINVFAKKIVEYFHKLTIHYNNMDFNISVSVGVSEVSPLIETADIILKEIKRDDNKSIGVYDTEFGYIQKIQKNMNNLITLKEAIYHDKIVPYFQPIYDNKTSKIIKYEVLARVVEDNKVMSIFPFLDIAKENKLYKYITHSIYQKAFERFKDTDIEFSLNIGLLDIKTDETMEFINDCMKKYEKTIPNLTFEILESDAVENYDSLKDFITFVKSKGAKIAIDDFGSGYSNFAHVLNLDIDYIKIDGSLIKYIDNNEKMEMIVETIVEFAKKIDVKIIAEFVHSKEVLDKVKELNIDYSQGFYLNEPKEDI